jgi:serine/threonine protein kinase
MTFDQQQPLQIRYLQFQTQDRDVFEVLDKYELKSLVGKGAYGKVCSAVDRQTSSGVAIKKISSVFKNAQDARRTLTELQILRLLSNHENIVAMRDVFPPPSLPAFNDLYIVYDLMETDLHQVLKSPQTITPEHARYIIYQILRALKFIHSAGVLHRDLKPSNILLSSNCDVQVCDFGLSAFNGSQDMLAEYVVTRWYRAPEILLSCSKYDNGIDVWSAGCIFAEILGRRPLFPGSDWTHVINLIFKVVGSPSYATVMSMCSSDAAQRFLNSVPKQASMNLWELFPSADPDALDLLGKMLAFDPKERITAAEALAHPYFQQLHDPQDEPEFHGARFDGTAFLNCETDDFRRLIFNEIQQYHPELA